MKIRTGERREGNVAALVADSNGIREVLEWTTKLEDLETIITSVLEWERRKT